MNQAYYALVTMSAFFNQKFDRKDRGATAVEYGLMVGLIAVVIIAAVAFLGDNLTTLFGDTAETLENPAENAPEYVTGP